MVTTGKGSRLGQLKLVVAEGVYHPNLRDRVVPPNFLKGENGVCGNLRGQSLDSKGG